MTPARRAVALAALVALALASLRLLTWVDGRAEHALRPGALATLTYVRVTSLAVCAALYAATGPAGSWRWPPRAAWRRVARVTAYWLAGSAVAVWLGAGVPHLRTALDWTAFLATGLAAEELLFRGAIFQLTAKVARAPWVPIAVSSVAFAAAHAQYHHELSRAALTQIAVTLPMGLVLGLARARTGSMWPPALVHLANNGLVLAHALLA